MEDTQVRQLKINANNIKSVLVDYNKKLQKIRLDKKNLITSESDEETKLNKQKKITSKNKISSLSGVKNFIMSPITNIFDKIMEFAGIILFGMVVSNLPSIIKGLNEFFSQNSKLITSIIQSIGSIATGILGLSELVSNLSSSKQSQIINDRNRIDADINTIKKSLDGVDSKTNDIKKALSTAPKTSTGNPTNNNQNPSGGNRRPVSRAKGGSIPSGKTQGQTTKSTSSQTFTSGETGRAKRARQTTNYFGTFNQAVKNSSENSITEQDNLKLLEKMMNNFSNFSGFMQTSMRSPLDTQSTDGGGGSSGGGIAIDVDPDEVIGKVGYTGRVSPAGPDGSHIHIEKVGGGSIPSDVKNNIYVSGIPMPSRLRFSSGIGWRNGKMHAGEDFAGDPDQPITLRGGLKFVGYSPDNGSGYGNRVTIQASDGTRYTLNHLNAGPTNQRELVKRQNQQQQNLGNFVLTGKQSSGMASFYGGPTDTYWEGRKTASGEIFNSNLMTAASNTIERGTYVRVTNNNNGRSVIVKINDTGGFGSLGRIIDLSAGAMRELGGINAGVIPVKVEVLTPKAKITPTVNPTMQRISDISTSSQEIENSTIYLIKKTFHTNVPYVVPYTLPPVSNSTNSQYSPLAPTWENFK